MKEIYSGIVRSIERETPNDKVPMEIKNVKLRLENSRGIQEVIIPTYFPSCIEVHVGEKVRYTISKKLLTGKILNMKLVF